MPEETVQQTPQEETAPSEKPALPEETGGEGKAISGPISPGGVPPEEEETALIPFIGADFFSPAAIIMFVVAFFFDIVSLTLLLFALDDFGILDILALFFVGGLMFIHSGSITNTSGAERVKKKIFKRLGLSFLLEIIPIVGSLSPSWTVAVFYHLKGEKAPAVKQEKSETA